MLNRSRAVYFGIGTLVCGVALHASLFASDMVAIGQEPIAVPVVPENWQDGTAWCSFSSLDQLFDHRFDFRQVRISNVMIAEDDTRFMGDPDGLKRLKLSASVSNRSQSNHFVQLQVVATKDGEPLYCVIADRVESDGGFMAQSSVPAGENQQVAGRSAIPKGMDLAESAPDAIRVRLMLIPN